MPQADAELLRALDLALAHRKKALAGGLAVGLDEIVGIDLPPIDQGPVDQAQLRALATLYLAADCEPAGVIAAVETLAGLSMTGAFSVDLGEGGALLHAFWRARKERISADERSAFFGRLFGLAFGPPPAAGGLNLEFEDRMLDLCEALYKLDDFAGGQAIGGFSQQARVRGAASRLVENLVGAGGGITAFLAEDILGTLREALAILTRPEARAAFGARDMWSTVEGIFRLARERRPDPRPYAKRGGAGMKVLVWLADSAPGLASGAVQVGLDDPVILSAIDWLEASLAIGEGPAPQPPARQPQPTQSPWAAIGA